MKTQTTKRESFEIKHGVRRVAVNRRETMGEPDYEAARQSYQAAIIINDLDSMAHRIEALEANPHYTDALVAVQKAKEAVTLGRTEIHHGRMKKRFAEEDRRRGR